MASFFCLNPICGLAWKTNTYGFDVSTGLCRTSGLVLLYSVGLYSEELFSREISVSEIEDMATFRLQKIKARFPKLGRSLCQISVDRVTLWADSSH